MICRSDSGPGSGCALFRADLIRVQRSGYYDDLSPIEFEKRYQLKTGSV